MAGLYIHIPFCKQLCYYCDFHFTVSFKLKDPLISAICKEIISRKEEYSEFIFDTIYFGGGTPSVLTIDEIVKIFDVIRKCCKISEACEVSFEANPDDLTAEYLKQLKKNTDINRLSIGVQSFHNDQLKLMNRRHSAIEAIHCIERSKKFGFNNINIDLIYGVPGMELKVWAENLEQFFKLDIPHLSAYHLTFEPKTVFSYYLKRGRLQQIKEDISIQQYETLIHLTEKYSYDHYEISNFAKNGLYSQHNLGYWTGKPYIGIGPSAHSYLMDQRRWNIAVNSKYIEELENNRSDYFESEIIDKMTAYNDYLLTSLRTKWGINKDFIRNEFGKSYILEFNKSASLFISDGTLLEENQNLFLSKKGFLIADYVISHMMIVE
jgi:oxygen-independent coproporphyrinogen III oxidase